MGTLYLLLMRGVAWLFYFAPEWLRRIMAGALGGLARRVGYRAAVVQQNLQYAYPGDAPKQVQFRESLLRDFYNHLGRLGCEIMMLFGPMRRYAQSQGEYIGADNWEWARNQGRGVILVAGHTGTWEVAAAMCAMEAEADVVLVSRRYKPEWLRRAVDEGRARCGVDTAYEPRTMPEIIARLKRNGVVAIVLDQYIAPPVGVRVPFFGVPVGTNVSIALLAKRTGAVVLPFKNYRRADGQVVVEAEPPVPWQSHENPEVELAINTAAYSAIVERQIREHPAQWLWSHRRFKGDLGPLREGEWEQGRRSRSSG